MTNGTQTSLLTLRNIILKQFVFSPATNEDEDFVFINTFGNNRGLTIRDCAVNQAAMRIEQHVNLSHITVHDGRHAFATRSRQLEYL